MTYQPTDEQIRRLADQIYRHSQVDAPTRHHMTREILELPHMQTLIRAAQLEAAAIEREEQEQRVWWATKERDQALDTVRMVRLWAESRLLPNRSTPAELAQHATAQHVLNLIGTEGAQR